MADEVFLCGTGAQIARWSRSTAGRSAGAGRDRSPAQLHDIYFDAVRGRVRRLPRLADAGLLGRPLRGGSASAAAGRPASEAHDVRAAETRRSLRLAAAAAGDGPRDVVSWAVIIGPIWLSFSYPWLVAYFVLSFDFYWLCRALWFAAR